VGGAHRDHKQMAAFLKRALNDAFRQVSDFKVKELLDRRYDRLQSYGRFTDTKADAKAVSKRAQPPSLAGAGADLRLRCRWVAYSGGADSTALLLAAASRWPGQVQAIHVHHGLQAAADGFVRHCADVCRLGVPLHRGVHVDARIDRREPRGCRAQGTLHARSRVRCNGAWCTGVLLGQHADDQVETCCWPEPGRRIAGPGGHAGAV
jgi:hypothetical protein